MFWKKSKNTQADFFVSIGAGLNQISLITEAKKLGFNIIGVDYNSSAPGFINCDLKIQESIVDYNEIYKKLNEMLFDGQISGIMTKSYGSAIRTTSYLAEIFKIPYLPFDKSDNFINKKKMKTVFKENSILSPQQYSFSSKSKPDKISGDKFPIIMKPHIGHAKIDVNLINTIDELKKKWPSQGDFKNIIFEKYIVGDEIIGAGIVSQGEFHLVDITDKKTTANPHFVDIMHISPSKYYDQFDLISKLAQSIADAFKIASSHLIMEFVVDNNDDTLSLIEAVPEFGGEFLTDIAIPRRTGYNFIRESIKAVTGSGFKAPNRKKIRNAVVVKYITGQKGTLVSCSPDGPKKIKGVLFSRIFKEIGSEVKKPETNLDRIGVVVARGKNIEEAISTADRASESFNIRIKKK